MSRTRATDRTGSKPAAKAKAVEQPRRAGPGRPEGVSTVRDEILDAAEIEFANRGYAGTSLRDVAERAKVTQALINYYFHSKHGLFDDVFLRRGRQVTEERAKRLKELRRMDEPADVRAIVEAFFGPALAMREMAGGGHFMRLNARLHTEPPEVSGPLRNAAYDQSSHDFAAVLHEALPHLSRADVYWRLTLTIGAYLYAFSDTHRLDILAPGICNPNDAEELFTAITSFITGGMQAPLLDKPSSSGQGRQRDHEKS